MLRVPVLAGLVCCLLTVAHAQTDDSRPADDEAAQPETAAASDEGPVDFLLRGTTQAEGTGPDVDPFAFDDAALQEPVPAIAPGRPEPDPDAPVGLELAGPDPLGATGSIGPPLYGPRPDAAARDDAEPARRRQVRDEDDADPFEAVGVRLGTFIVRPQLEAGIEVTDNVAGGADKISAAAVRVASRVSGESDWSRHHIAFEMRGAASRYDDETYDEQTLDASLNTRLDVSRSTAVEGGAYYSRSLESFTDPDTPGGAASRPAVESFGSEIGLTHTNNSIAFSFRAGIDRETHEEVALAGGGVADLSDQDQTGVWGRGRVTLVRSERIRPFVETAVGRIEHDNKVDASGFERDRDWVEVNAGVLVDLGPKLAGEVSVGFRRDVFDDPALSALEAVNVAGELVWSPERLTEVRLALSTETEGSTQAGVSGSVTHAADVSVTRRLNSRLTGTIGSGLAWQYYTGFQQTDITGTASAELAYAFSRFASVVGRYTYTRVESDDPDTTGDEHRAGILVRVQR